MKIDVPSFRCLQHRFTVLAMSALSLFALSACGVGDESAETPMVSGEGSIETERSIAAQVPAEVLKLNPNVLPAGDYPFWPEYDYRTTGDLDQIQSQPWVAEDHTIEGWDWALPPFVEPAERSLVGLQRIIGLNRPFEPLDLKFKANAVGILWVDWREIEPEPGVFDFSKVIARVDQAEEAGLEVILRILTTSKLRGTGPQAISRGEAPLWLGAKGVPLLPRESERHNLNFDPSHPVFHQHYLRLVAELAKTGLPDSVKAAYVGYASHSFGDEGIGPYPETNFEGNDALPHVRERLDAWHAAFRGMEHKVFMGGSSHYGFAKGFGVRRGFVEMYLYHIPSRDLGQYIDTEGYLAVDESAPILKFQCFNGDVNEEYEPAWATPRFNYRFGSSTRSFPYRYFASNLRALQMRCTYIHTTGHLIPEMLPFIALQLGRTVEDAPDVWSFLRTSYLGASVYRNNDWRDRPISPEERREGIAAKNLERWLYQRDAPGFETTPAIKIPHAIRMWMVQKDKYFDTIARRGERIGFDIDARWLESKEQLAVKVTFLDDHAGSFRLRYQTGTGRQSKQHPLVGDGRLKTATFFIPAPLKDGVGDAFDFSLEAGPDTPDITVAMVRVIDST